MAYIHLNTSRCYTGMPLSFKAPCDCTAVEGLAIEMGSTIPGGASLLYTFKFKDAHGNILTGLGNLFAAGAMVKVVLEMETTISGYAYIQNADTNAYLEKRLPKSVPVTLTSSGWSNNVQTIAVAGVLADEAAQLIQPVPALASQTAYLEAGIRCTAQAENSLTFTADEKPAADIALYVVIQEVAV